ncbi:BZ3500_MvSof-1268-A1-R1_Chr10-2g02919 [Microbotryum saponariae]|uniref:BZ3500_MvSof-1268-A1-R1_Chr10-2g02919 protein n=1 Tax=Microbotryum saponariae TaxID=289078 RepID=A0A2X0KYS2_9BASI|nr:BZ3501_MvSof-1269-A2-R1_Chr10-2g02505 [Microbotryum saponariae]SDA01742.1 BZ3500_MvSof-1268-A1-R1_Chr10-2g02919 [Microbotryum saponariae]
MFSKFTGKKNKNATLLDDDEKAYAYENDAARVSSSPVRRRRTADPSSRDRYIGSYAPNPTFIRVLRFLLFGLTSLASLTTAGVAIGVVHYYNSLRPNVIAPSWGSLIAIIVFGIGTPGVLYIPMLFFPYMFKERTFTGILLQTRIELLTLFAVSAVWISGALALACDLRGRENCLWDGYYHFPKPADFDSVCTLINVDVALAYTTFGLTCVQLVVISGIAGYILLYLDQEVLTERTNDMGGRAHRARQQALASRRALAAADIQGLGRAGPMSSQRSLNGPGPMAGGVATSRLAPTMTENSSGRGGPMAGGRYSRDEEHEGTDFDTVVDDAEETNEEYYGYEQRHRRRQSRV